MLFNVDAEALGCDAEALADTGTRAAEQVVSDCLCGAGQRRRQRRMRRSFYKPPQRT